MSDAKEEVLPKGFASIVLHILGSLCNAVFSYSFFHQHMQAFYAVIYSAGDKYGHDKSVQRNILREHLLYMQQLHHGGKLLMAGPFINTAGGQAVIRAGGEDEVLQIINRDPAVIHHIFSYQVYQRQIRLHRPIETGNLH